MSPRVTRTRLGVSLERAARLIGVNRATLSLYEANPEAVGPRLRARIEAVYRRLAKVVELADDARTRAKEG